MKTTKTLCGILTITTAFAMNGRSQVFTIPVDTGTASEWSVTGGGATNVVPYIFNAGLSTPTGGVIYENCLSVTSTADSAGTFLPGGSLANFDGFWVAVFTFSLPTNATNISLYYTNFYADDRAVLTLNGNVFTATGISAQSNSVGSMVLTDGGPLQAYSSFSSPDGFFSGTVTNNFIIGGTNIIEAIINNTHDGIYGSDINLSSGDGTLLGLSATISYSSVPSVTLLEAVVPSFSNLSVGTNYQLQVSAALSAWTNSGSAFTATNSTMIYPQYFNVASWDQLYFRLQVAP